MVSTLECKIVYTRVGAILTSFMVKQIKPSTHIVVVVVVHLRHLCGFTPRWRLNSSHRDSTPVKMCQFTPPPSVLFHTPSIYFFFSQPIQISVSLCFSEFLFLKACVRNFILLYVTVYFTLHRITLTCYICPWNPLNLKPSFKFSFQRQGSTNCVFYFKESLSSCLGDSFT